MTDNIVPWNGITKLDLDPQRVIQSALDAELGHVVIIGFGKDGSEYFASSYADGAPVVWHCERAKFKLMVMTDELST